MTRRALFLDRDGTLVYPRHYPRRPEQLVLYEGVCDDLRTIQRNGFLLILITNQSGIARGYFDEDALFRMHQHLLGTLANEGVHINGIYYCPHHPEGAHTELSRSCDCRKPNPGMLLEAAREFSLDLGRSWFIGDILDDVEAGNRSGCRTILVDLGTESAPESDIRTPDFVARNTLHALKMVRSVELDDSLVEMNYRPASWERVLTSAPDDAYQPDRAGGRRHV